jgi:hypothetical protein
MIHLSFPQTMVTEKLLTSSLRKNSRSWVSASCTKLADMAIDPPLMTHLDSAMAASQLGKFKASSVAGYEKTFEWKALSRRHSGIEVEK